MFFSEALFFTTQGNVFRTIDFEAGFYQIVIANNVYGWVYMKDVQPYRGKVTSENIQNQIYHTNPIHIDGKEIHPELQIAHQYPDIIFDGYFENK